jgi:8-oxo-dGTP pyrophosphatase MutT (NUDIX family)
MFEFNPSLRSSYTDRLSAHRRAEIVDTALAPAAVAIVIAKSTYNDEACFLLTRRAKGLKRHSGQYALPGGRLEPNESTETAALRELKEELGLTASISQVAGQLDDFATRSGFRITPVVVWLDQNTNMTLDPGEVDAVFSVPIRDLNHPDVPRLHQISESPSPVLSIWFESLQEEVFSPTAAILYQFREIVLFGRETRVAHYEQPVFAWR